MSALDVIAAIRGENVAANLKRFGEDVALLESSSILGRSNPDVHQKEGGPGRGKYQYELDEGGSGANKTAITRYRNFAEEYDYEIPEEWDKLLTDGDVDFSKLPEALQDDIFYADKERSPEEKITLANIVDLESSVRAWGTGHKGKGVTEEDIQYQIKKLQDSAARGEIHGWSVNEANSKKGGGIMDLNNPEPLRGVADNLAQYGRYGDSMLVHMNPIEVEGIASLSPTGQLTTNPVTGQKEAFLPFLIPMLASWGGAALGTGTALGAIGGGALASGLSTWATTGDFKKGLLSGIMGGIGGKIFGAGADAAGKTVADATSAVGLPPGASTMNLGEVATAQTGAMGNLGLTQAPTTFGGKLASGFAGGKESLGAMGTELMKPSSLLGLGVAGGTLADIKQQEDLQKDFLARQREDEEEGKKWEGIMEEGFEQSRADYPYSNSYQRYDRGGIVSINPEDYARRRNGFNTLDSVPVLMQGGGETAAFRQARIRGPQTITPEELAAAGRPGFGPEITYFQPRRVGVTDADAGTASPTGVNIPGLYSTGFLSTGGNLFGNYNVPLQPSPVSDARSLIERDYGDNGTISDEAADTAADAAVDYVTGTAPATIPPSPSNSLEEILAEIQRPTLAPPPPPPVMAGPLPTEAGPPPPPPPAAAPPPQQVESPIPPENQQAAAASLAEWTPEMQAELEAALAALGRSGFQEGGPTDIPPGMTPPPMGPPPMGPPPMGPPPMGPPLEQEAPADNAVMDQLIDQTAMAILGQLPEEQAEIIITQFINEFGEEVFQMLREQVLQSVSGPEAQTQGMVQGQGGGMDDQVPGMIGDQQPVAVSPGEFIVPADVVSGLGDGSSDAGADKLDTMMDQVRMAKTGGMIQPKRISNTVLPV